MFFFQTQMLIYFTKVVEAIYCSMNAIFLEEHLQPGIAYMQCNWQIFQIKAYCYFKVAPEIQEQLLFFREATCSDPVFSKVLCVSLEQTFAVMPFFIGIEFIRNTPFSIIKEQLQPGIISNLLCFCSTGIVKRRYHSY